MGKNVQKATKSDTGSFRIFLLLPNKIKILLEEKATLFGLKPAQYVRFKILELLGENNDSKN